VIATAPIETQYGGVRSSGRSSYSISRSDTMMAAAA
jgi:hypothetical protein